MDGCEKKDNGESGGDGEMATPMVQSDWFIRQKTSEEGGKGEIKMVGPEQKSTRYQEEEVEEEEERKMDGDLQR